MALSSVNEAMRELSTGKDLKEEMALTVGPNANWEEFLIPAPMCIGLIGELMCISTTKDFTLNKTPPKDGFKLLNYPDSFRASLVQVSNAAYDAFRVAHTNMDRIRLMTDNVPNQLTDAVNILLNGSNEELEDMLPIPMNAIDETANNCLVLATTAEDKYIFVMELTAELLEACTNARGIIEEELQETKIALEIAKDNKTVAEEQKKMAKQTYEELQSTVKKAEDAYYKASDSMPNGWETIGMNVVEGLANSFSTALDGAVKIMALKYGNTEIKTPSDKETPKEGTDTGDKSKPSVGPSIDKGTREAYDLAIRIQTFTDQLAVNCVDENGELKQSLKQDINRIIYLKEQLKNCMHEATNIAAAENAVKERVVALCKKGVAVCDEVKETSKAIQDDVEVDKALVEKIKSLQGDVMSLSSEGKVRIGSSPTDSKGPNQIVMQKGASEGSTAAQQAVLNARFQIEQTSANLEFTREKYDTACDRMIKTSTQLRDIMADISRLDMTEVDFEKIRKTLIMGIKAIGQLREEWAKIVMFFSMMSNVIKCSLNTSLKDFLKYAETSQESSIRGYPITSLKRDMIYQQAFQSAKTAYVVNMISATYVEVSKTYLIDRIAGLGKLLGYDPETQADEIRIERQKLFQDMNAVQDEIQCLVQQRKDDFNRQVTSRINETTRKLEDAMPVDTALENQKRIEEAVQRGTEKAKEDSKDELATLGMSVDDFI